jgi:hypothetical protein
VYYFLFLRFGTSFSHVSPAFRLFPSEALTPCGDLPRGDALRRPLRRNNFRRDVGDLLPYGGDVRGGAQSPEWPTRPFTSPDRLRWLTWDPAPVGCSPFFRQKQTCSADALFGRFSLANSDRLHWKSLNYDGILKTLADVWWTVFVVPRDEVESDLVPYFGEVAVLCSAFRRMIRLKSRSVCW